jgi:hypothetical protein
MLKRPLTIASSNPPILSTSPILMPQNLSKLHLPGVYLQKSHFTTLSYMGYKCCKYVLPPSMLQLWNFHLWKQTDIWCVSTCSVLMPILVATV